MRNTIKAAIFAFAGLGAGLGALAVPASAQPYDPYDNGYGDNGYDQPYDQAYGADPYNTGYCDPGYDCPDDYYDLPLYYGDVYYDGSLFNGPVYYRDDGGRRQFWRHGGWHYGDFRGGRFGPALGRDFYRNRGFGGRGFTGGNFGVQDYARRAYQPQQSWQGRGFGGGQTWNRGGSFGGQDFARRAHQPTDQGRGFGGGQNFNRGRQDGARQAYQPQQSVPVQPYNGAQFGNRGGFAGRSNFQSQAPQAQTPQPYVGPQGRGGEFHGSQGRDGGGESGRGGWHHDR